jgi:hypothetical protein
MERSWRLVIPVVVALSGCGVDGSRETGSVHQATCYPLNCYNDSATCGTIDDGCGGTVNCGTCPKGEVCTNNNCYSVNCKPSTCGPNSCGCSGDGCGGTVCCGGCPVGSYCNSVACAQLCNNCPAMYVVTTFFQPCTNGVCNMGEGNAGESFAISATPANGLSLPLDPPPFTWTVVAGSLPAGLSLSLAPNTNNALISGKPKQAGTSTFTLQVEDDVQRTAQQAFDITIGSGNLDSLTITGASFNLHTSTLHVSAIDDNADAVLTAYKTSTGKAIGTLTNSGTGTFSGNFRINPGTVTVTSSRGATATSPVKVIY